MREHSSSPTGPLWWDILLRGARPGLRLYFLKCGVSFLRVFVSGDELDVVNLGGRMVVFDELACDYFWLFGEFDL